MKNYKITTALILSIFFLLLSSCERLIDVGVPVTTTTTDIVFNSNGSATAALTGIYMQMAQENVNPGDGVLATTITAGLMADELDIRGTFTGQANQALVELFLNELTPLSPNPWNNLYNRVYAVNSAIEGLNASRNLTPAIKEQLLGEAYFLRAFYYFYLVNYYGDVPLILRTDYTLNAALDRTAAAEIYNQILSDLDMAIDILADIYLNGGLISETGERVRPTKSAALALRARVYLYMNDFPEAETDASKVIDNGTYGLSALNDAFLMNNKEAIWQLPSLQTGLMTNTVFGRMFIVDESSNSVNGSDYVLTESLQSSFEDGDLRKTNWINTGYNSQNTLFTFPYKYKIGWENVPKEEYVSVLRLGEVYLIRSEARLRQNNINGAQADLNVIRNRAGLPNTTAGDSETLQTAIEHERRVELFTEWGHRFFDLRRWGKADEILSAKGATWQATDQLYPIPKSELDKAPGLVQNAGYQ